MIILEGPDGSGKSVLLGHLMDHFQLPQHERFATSLGGPVDDYVRKAFRDVQSIHTQPLSIYDRHPLISEYAYATAIPERVVRDDFLEGWAMNMLKQFSRSSLVIFCIPPYPHVRHQLLSCQTCKHIHLKQSSAECLTIRSDGEVCDCPSFDYRQEMPGVVENIAKIYEMYRLLHVFWPEPNRAMLYDWTDPESIKRVFSRCQIHISEWKKAHV